MPLEPIECYFRIVEALHLRSTCDLTAQGALIVKDGALVGVGWTHSIKGQPDCCDAGHDLAPIRRLGPGPGVGGKSWIESQECQRTIGAEVSALLQAGLRARGATLYCSRMPSPPMTAALIEAGIKKVCVALVDESDHEGSQILLAGAGIPLIALEATADESDSLPEDA